MSRVDSQFEKLFEIDEPVGPPRLAPHNGSRWAHAVLLDKHAPPTVDVPDPVGARLAQLEELQKSEGLRDESWDAPVLAKRASSTLVRVNGMWRERYFDANGALIAELPEKLFSV